MQHSGQIPIQKSSPMVWWLHVLTAAGEYPDQHRKPVHGRQGVMHRRVGCLKGRRGN